MRRLLFVPTLLALAGGLGCTIQQTETPPVTGPSTFALAMDLTATPDSIVQNGSDKSTLRVRATDANGRPMPNLGVTLQVTSNGLPVDYGTLSARTVYTGGDGTASATYTAPPAPAPSVPTYGCHGLAGPCVTILANPIGTNYMDSLYNHPTVDIRLAPPQAPLVDPANPQALFTIAPGAPAALELVTFNASSSTAGAGHTIVSYSWDFGDGTKKTGVVASHDFGTVGAYYVMLTVTNDAGQTSNITYPVAVH